MNILIFSAFSLDYKGGYATAVSNLAQHLRAKGHQVIIPQFNYWNPAWLNRSYPIPKFSVWKELQKIDADQVDVVFTNTRFFLITLLGLWWAKRRNIPVIHIEHGTCHPVLEKSIFLRFIAIIDKFIGRRVFPAADKVVGVSQSACQFAASLGAKSPVEISNGIDLSFWQVKKSVNSNTAYKTIIFVGRLVYAKGVQDLLYAVYYLQNHSHLKLKTQIVGDGPYKKELSKLTNKLHLHNVEFLGAKNKQEIKSILMEADIAVNPSYSEGMPMSVLEFAAVGLPIIATDVGGTREIINSNNGILIEPRQPLQIAKNIELLASNNKLAAQLGANARRYCEQIFNIEKAVDQYLSLCQQLIKKEY